MARTSGKMDEMRRLLDERGVRWEDCPERYGRDDDESGLTLPATCIFAGGRRYVASEFVGYRMWTPNGIETETGIRVETEFMEPRDAVEAILG